MSTSELPRINELFGAVGPLSANGSVRQTASETPFWTTAAPDKVVKRSLSGDEEKAWLTWRKHLGRRKSPLAGTPIETLGTGQALLWGLSEQDAPRELLAAIAPALGKNGAPNEERQRALEEIIAGGAGSLDERTALGLLACAYELPLLASWLSKQRWWELLGRLRQTALDAAALDLTATPLLHQRLAGELPLALAVLFPEVSGCAELLPAARSALSAGFEELLDGEGTPHCRYLAIHQPLAACWTRARILGASVEDGCWNDDAEAQYPFTVREMLRLARRDGSSLFSGLPIERRVPASTAHFFTTAVDLSKDPANLSTLRSFRGNGLPKSKAREDSKRRPAAANHSEWAQVAVLRPNWKRSSPHMAIAYGGRTTRGELVIGRDRLLTGDWRFSCLLDEKQATPVGEWEELCWVSDEDVDYLELQIELSGGLRVQRQFCLARRDRFLFIADAVLGNDSRPLRYTMHFPLSDATAAAAAETREVSLSAGKPRALMIPLALPEWRADRRGGELTTGDAVVELHQATNGKGLYAPLWIDLDPGRHSKPFTWRQLAVAEERHDVSRDVAVGYRVQFGKKQWLVYRSLTAARNRTVLGHNLATEFLIARFDRDGSVKTLIEVE